MENFWAPRPAIPVLHPPDGDGKLVTKYLLLQAEWELSQRTRRGEKDLNFVLRPLSPLTELDHLIS